jgi:hypothetical protein
VASTNSNNPPVRQTLSAKQPKQLKQLKQPKQQQPPKPAKKADLRVFLRLPTASRLRDIGPHGARVYLTDKVPGGITKIQSIQTGYAITTETDEGKAFLLSPLATSLVHTLEGKFETATEFHPVVISRIPKSLWNPSNTWTPTSLDDISAEAERVSGMKPLGTKLSAHPIGDDCITAVVAFPRPLKKAIQLFGCSAPSRPTRPKSTPIQCERCYAYHDSRACRSSRRCVHCGSTKQDHTCRTQCLNCHGPHDADYPKCPARPTTRKGITVRPTREALLSICRVGRLAFQQASNHTTPPTLVPEL